MVKNYIEKISEKKSLAIFSRLKGLGLKGSLAILDQAFFSGANFLASILLARWLLPSQYGVYAIAMAVMQFGYQLQGSLVLEPMSVLGPAGMHHQLAGYIRAQLKMHFLISSVVGILIILISLFFIGSNTPLVFGLINMGISLPFMLLPWFLRRGFYVLSRPDRSVWVSVVYAIILLFFVWLFSIFGFLSAQTVIGLFAMSGLISSLLLLTYIPKDENRVLTFQEMIAKNWSYGKWLAVAAVFIATAAQAQTFIVGSILGIESAGVFKALQNLIQPIIIIFSALSALALPSFSYEYGQGRIISLNRKGVLLLVTLALIAVSFYLSFYVWQSEIMQMFYGDRYSAYLPIVPLLGMIPMAAVPTYGFYFLLLSLQKPRAVMTGSIFWGIGSIISAIVFTSFWGLRGSILSIICSYLLAGSFFSILYVYYYFREKSKVEAG